MLRKKRGWRIGKQLGSLLTMGKRRKATSHTAVQKKGARGSVSSVRPAAAFFFVPATDLTIQLLTRAVLRDIPCATCGAQIHRIASFSPSMVSTTVLPILEAARAKVQATTSRANAENVNELRPLTGEGVPLLFDPSPYLSVLRAQPLVAPSRTVVALTAAPRPSSTHILSLQRIEVERPSSSVHRRASLFRPPELPELRHFVERQSAEFFLPRLEERARLHQAIPGGIVGVGKEVAAGTLSVVDDLSAPARAVVRALPSHMGFDAYVEEVLPIPTQAVIPKTLAWASGVPKNLPIVSWYLAPPPAPPPVSPEYFGVSVQAAEAVPSLYRAGVSADLSHQETIIDRLERVPERILSVLRQPSRPWHAVGAFAVLLGIVMLMPLGAVSFAAKGEGAKAAILSSSKEGVAALVAAGYTAAQRDGAGAASSFSLAAASFADARAALDQSVGGLRSVAARLPGVGQTVQAVDRLLAVADALAEAGARLSPALIAEQQNPLVVLSGLLLAVHHVTPELVAADASLASLDAAAIPEDVREEFFSLKDAVHVARQTVEGFPEKAEALAMILGRDTRKRYLVVFQNANELRPTGGFIGSIAEVTVDKGVITEIRVPKGGPYDGQGDLRASLLPPLPLRRIAARWEMQDANWFPDFPTSAEKLAWFYEKGGGPSVDGVLALTSDVLPAILTLTGPVSMPAYQRTMTAENVIRETQQIVETEYDLEAHAPKQFIGDLLAVLLERLRASPAEKMIAAGELFATTLQEKTLQMHFFDEEIARVAATAGWNGALSADTGDVLMVVDTNIGGGKTDGVVEKTGTIETDIAPDGTVTHTLTLRYLHRGIPSDPFTGKRYQNYLRLYVPEGSRLVEATGNFGVAPALPPASDDLTEDPLLATSVDAATNAQGGTDQWTEQGRTVFGHWLSVPAGGEAMLRFVYTSGAGVTRQTVNDVLAWIGHDVASYRFRVERQPGAHRALSVQVSSPPVWEVVWQSPDLLGDTGAPSSFTKDRWYAVIFRK